MDYDYIDTDAFRFCVTSSTFSECLAENQIRTLYIQPSDLKELQGNTEIICQDPISFPDAYRNIFNHSTTVVHKCKPKLGG